MEKFLKTYEVAKICQVAQGTVIRWIKEGKLPAASTAGGHHRIQIKDLLTLLKNLRLPIPAELSSYSEGVVSPPEKMRILIVDDEPEVRKMIHWMIDQEFPATEVEEAGEGFIAGWKVKAFRPHLVILDLVLPGFDGFGVCEFIRQLPDSNDTKIIAMSALMNSENSKRILSLGANDFLSKPFDLDVLKKKISTQLNRHPKSSFTMPFDEAG